MTNIAIAGRFAAGKSTLSAQFIHLYGYTRGSFAERLKQVASDVYNGGRPIEKDGQYEVVDLTTGQPQILSGREVLQRLGQAVKSMDRLFWVRWFARDAEQMFGPIVLDDLRFPYEADYLREHGWLIVKVETPERVRMERYRDLYGRYPTASEMSHESETSVDLIEPHLIVSGDGDTFEAIQAILQASEREVR